MPNSTYAQFDFSIEWKSPSANHIDCYDSLTVDLSNDKLPSAIKEQIINLAVGESLSIKMHAKDLIHEEYSSDKVISFNADLFNTQFKNQHSPAMLYRFYPSAIAWQGLNTAETDYTPFRLISNNQDNMVGDKNHPLAKYYLNVNAKKIQQFEREAGDTPKKNIGRLLTARGPGMQAPFEFGDSVLFKHYPFKDIEAKNSSKPIIDANTIIQIEKLHSELLAKHSKVLDVMSSDTSYLSTEYQTGLLVGIGDNEQLLSTNKRLDTYTEQNLNEDTTLPFETNSFDDAICSLSIECLIDPLALMKEIARVVNKNGKFIISFTDEFVPNSTISLWPQLHAFERIQLVLEYFRSSGLFSDLNTLSKRNIVNSSENAKPSKAASNLFAVWGSIN